MASKLAQAIQSQDYYITINSQYMRQWRDFTLQKGHVFGYSPELDGEHSDNPDVKGLTGLFVVQRALKSGLLLYIARRTPDRYIWETYAIERDGRTGQRILEVLAKRVGGVVFKPFEAKEVGYNPPLTTRDKGPFIPMRNMRIPMGAWKSPTLRAELTVHGINGRGLTDHEVLLKNITDRRLWNEKKLAGEKAC